ncbi:MAG: NAD(P)H-binding protein [Aeromicrobium sp.]
MRIAVAGGTGLMGSLVVELAAADGHEVVVLARSRGVDLVTGDGVETALAGVDGVVDVTNIDTLSKDAAAGFFSATTRHLLDAEQRAGVRHHVVLSIVGVDRVDLGYYVGKRAQEALVVAGDVPWTILRATQFHEFAAQMLDRVPGPVAVLPRQRNQPVAAREVARALVDHVTGPPAGLAPELAGPQEENLADMARRLLRARGSRRRVVQVRLPIKGAGAMAGGGLLPTTDGPRGVQTYDQWLTEQVP